MKQLPGQWGRIAALRLLLHRFAFGALVMAALALMAMGKADLTFGERLRTALADTLAPVLDVMSRPAAATADVLATVKELTDLRAENARLREENARLGHWETVARRLDGDNRLLRAQVAAVPDPDSSFITARVVADSGGAYVHAMLINVGDDSGVRKGQAAMVGEAMVGRVSEIGEDAARILLITDLNSRVPVMVESSRAKAMLIGDNSDQPILGHLFANAAVAPGDRIVTSGHGGAFPPGLPIGVVSSVKEGVVRVQPLVGRHQIEFVTLVDYGLAGIIAAPPPGPERAERNRR